MKKKQKSSLKNRALSQTAVLIIVTMCIMVTVFIWSFIQGHLMNGESTKKKIW